MPAPFNNYDAAGACCELPYIIQDPAVRQNFDALVGLSSTTAMPNPTTGEVAPDGPGGGGGGAGVTYVTDIIATTESGTSAAAWQDLATVGPTISIDIPQNSFVMFVASVIFGHPNNVAGSGFHIVNTGGNFNLACDVGNSDANTKAISPGGYQLTAGVAPTTASFLGDEGAYRDDFGGANTMHVPVPFFFYSGVDLTGEGFKLQYRSILNGGAYSTFSSRRLTAVVFSL